MLNEGGGSPNWWQVRWPVGCTAVLVLGATLLMHTIDWPGDGHRMETTSFSPDQLDLLEQMNRRQGELPEAINARRSEAAARNPALRTLMQQSGAGSPPEKLIIANSKSNASWDTAVLSSKAKALAAMRAARTTTPARAVLDNAVLCDQLPSDEFVQQLRALSTRKAPGELTALLETKDLTAEEISAACSTLQGEIGK